MSWRCRHYYAHYLSVLGWEVGDKLGVAVLQGREGRTCPLGLSFASALRVIPKTSRMPIVPKFVSLCHSKILVCAPKLAHNSGSGMKLPVVGGRGGPSEFRVIPECQFRVLIRIPNRHETGLLCMVGFSACSPGCLESRVYSETIKRAVRS